jgi:hypothetical protein
MLAAPLSLPASEPVGESRIRLANPRTQRWQIGVEIQARGAMAGVVASMPVPMPWPEQSVRIVSEDLSPHVRSLRYRVIDDGVNQMVVTIPRLASGETAFALVTLEIVKHDIVPPENTDRLRVPERVPRDLRKYLAPSPYIESNDRVIQEAARQVTRDLPGAWEQAEAIFDWVREKVEYRFDREIKGARQALDDGFGDCEELTSLFIALCRSVGIPARAVWVPGHCYPEFYLEDEHGQGHWYPCQAAGTRIFGAMPEARPILQKGDNFRLPGSPKPQRYVQETVSAKNAQADPQVRFVQRNLDDPVEPADPAHDRP